MHQKRKTPLTISIAGLFFGFIVGIVVFYFQKGVNEIVVLLSLGFGCISSILFIVISEFYESSTERESIKLEILKELSKIAPTTIVVSGQSKVFRALSNLVEDAKESIWVARFSYSEFPSNEADYLFWTKKRIY